jgi:hypothetical protein
VLGQSEGTPQGAGRYVIWLWRGICLASRDAFPGVFTRERSLVRNQPRPPGRDPALGVVSSGCRLTAHPWMEEHRFIADRQITLTVNRRNALLGIAFACLIAIAGVGGYLIGQSTGEDLDTARAEGTTKGQREGAIQGAKQGFAEGRREGRDKAYSKSYEENYRKAYREAYEDAGLDPPNAVEIPKPEER